MRIKGGFFSRRGRIPQGETFATTAGCVSAKFWIVRVPLPVSECFFLEVFPQNLRKINFCLVRYARKDKKHVCKLIPEFAAALIPP